MQKFLEKVVELCRGFAAIVALAWRNLTPPDDENPRQEG